MLLILTCEVKHINYLFNITHVGSWDLLGSNGTFCHLKMGSNQDLRLMKGELKYLDSCDQWISRTAGLVVSSQSAVISFKLVHVDFTLPSVRTLQTITWWKRHFLIILVNSSRITIPTTEQNWFRRSTVSWGVDLTSKSQILTQLSKHEVQGSIIS